MILTQVEVFKNEKILTDKTYSNDNRVINNLMNLLSNSPKWQNASLKYSAKKNVNFMNYRVVTIFQDIFFLI